MNRGTSGLQLSKAIYGFIQHKAAEELRPRTLYSNKRTLNMWLEFRSDIGFDDITSQDIRSYLA